jgi:hypothetical protein
MGSGKKDLKPGHQAISDAKHVVEHAAAEKGIHGVAHAISKAGPVAAKLVSSTVGKVLPIVGGGVPGAITAAFSGNAGRGFHAQNKPGYIDGIPPEEFAKMQQAQRARTAPAKNLITNKMVTVKSPAYSGQSTMGKALMASAKKKV